VPRKITILLRLLTAYCYHQLQ